MNDRNGVERRGLRVLGFETVMETRQAISNPVPAANQEIISPPSGANAPAKSGRGRAGLGLFTRSRKQVSGRVVGDVTDLSRENASRSRLGRRFAGWLTFVVLVLVPVAASILYFGFVASDQFTSEMRFVVRLGPQQENLSSSSTVASIAMSIGSGAPSAGGSLEDAHIVASYIHSRAILDDVAKQVNLQEIFSRSEADFYARLKPDPTTEELLDFWDNMVMTYIDGPSGIVTVTVRAFRPTDAVTLAKVIGVLSEKLVNDIAVRARQDALRRATEEVTRAQNNVYAALVEMERFRNSQGMIDPVSSATETSKLLLTVMADELAIENQLFVARRSLSADSPSVRSLQAKLDGLKRQSATLRQQMAGQKPVAGNNVAAALVKFEELAVNQKLAESLYTMAEQGLDRARRTAEAQSVYLTMFVQPGLPEEYSYPKRVVFPLLVAISCLILWSIGALIASSVEDHRL